MRNTVLPLGLALAFLGMAAPSPGQSLWPKRGESSLFADHRAFKVGDVLTVIVEEESSVSSSAAMNLKKSTAAEGKIENADLGSKAKVFPANSPHLKTDSARTFDGEGEYALSGRMSTRLTVVVLEVLPNGNLVVEGSRDRVQGGEKTLITISGIVRPEDVASDNTVSSSALAQGKIAFKTSGPLTRSSSYGWFNWLLDFLWPF